MWFDPARWNPTAKPHFAIKHQLGTLETLEIFYLQSLTPLVFFFLLIATAPRGSRRRIWWEGWVVYIPAVAGILAYALVIVTARYVMPFVVTGVLVLLALTPRPRRMLPLLALLGVVVPLGMEAASNETRIGLTTVAAIVAGMVAGALISDRRPALWTLGVIASALIARLLLPPSAADVSRMGAVLVSVLFWFAARSAIRANRTIQFAQRSTAALTILLVALLGLRFEIRVGQDALAFARARLPGWGNVSVNIANELAGHGVAPGTRVALIGPHAESYWARSGRLNIVANVPRTTVSEFWKLPADARDALLNEFAAAGATVAIASVGPDVGAPDSSWTPVKYRGWIRKLR
jgi:hypothetical protein